MQQYLEAGKVVTTHGVRGEMKLELWCDGVAFLKKVGRLYPSLNGGKCYQIKSIRAQGQMALLQLEGVVTSVDHPGAQDIYTVKSPSGKEYLFPGVDAFLKERNPPEGYILVTPIPGLLDDDFDSERSEEEAE